jgi:hypothetical protein
LVHLKESRLDMAAQSVDERLSAMEDEINLLKVQMRAVQPSGTETPWWQKWFGAFKDDPDFDSAMERGAAYRRSQPMVDEASDDVSA